MFRTDSYLYLSRHRIFYFRAILPNDVASDFRKREYRRSMQTRNPRIAQSMARALRVCFEGLLEPMRVSMITWEELRGALDRRLEQLIRLEREKLKYSGPYPVIADDIWKLNVIPDCENAINEISASRRDSPSSGIIPEFARNLAEDILQANSLPLDRDSDLFTKFCEATVRMYLEFTNQKVLLNDEARSFHKIGPTASDFVPSGTHATSPLISEAIDGYCKEMVSDKRWTPRSEGDIRGSYSTFLKVVSDRPISAVTRDVARFYKESLQKLPSNMSKKPQYRNLPVSDILKMVVPEEHRLSRSKVNLDLGRVSALFNWAVGNEYIGKNPFAGMKVNDDVDDQDKRCPFEISDLPGQCCRTPEPSGPALFRCNTSGAAGTSPR